MKIPRYSAGRMALRRRIRSFVEQVSWARLSVYWKFRRAGGAVQRRRGRILVYHSISDDPHNPFAVSPAEFAKQMEYLAARWNPIALHELAGAVAAGRTIPERAVAVTFDDGYQDNYTHAFPVLRKHGIPATVFLVAGEIRDDGASPPRGSAGDIVFMSWNQAREMARGGVTIGSHTITHPSLALLDPAALARELGESRSMIEERLGMPVTALAYPYGTHRDVTPGVVEAARAAGYSFACMAINGTVGPQTGVFALPRTKIEYGDDLDLFEGALDGGLDVFTVLDRLRKLQGKRTPPDPEGPHPELLEKKEGNR